MGAMAFGEGFKLINRNDEDYYYTTTARFMPMLSVFSPTPWLFSIIIAITILNRDANNFAAFESALFWKRFQTKPKEPDVIE